MTDIDQVRMTSVVLSHEARLHRFGWDRAPQLFVVYDIADPVTDKMFRAYNTADRHFRATTRVAGYAAKAIVTAWPADPTLCLESFALGLVGLGETIAAPLMEALRMPGVLGIGWAAEAWAKSGGRDVIDATLHRDVRVKDMPGAREQRLMWVLDFGGHLHTVTRTRGGRPEVHPHPVLFHGAHATSLKMMVAAVTDTLPPRDEWPLVYPDLAELYQPPGSPLRERTA